MNNRYQVQQRKETQKQTNNTLILKRNIDNRQDKITSRRHQKEKPIIICLVLNQASNQLIKVVYYRGKKIIIAVISDKSYKGLEIGWYHQNIIKRSHFIIDMKAKYVIKAIIDTMIDCQQMLVNDLYWSNKLNKKHYITSIQQKKTFKKLILPKKKSPNPTIANILGIIIIGGTIITNYNLTQILIKTLQNNTTQYFIILFLKHLLKLIFKNILSQYSKQFLNKVRQQTHIYLHHKIFTKQQKQQFERLYEIIRQVRKRCQLLNKEAVVCRILRQTIQNDLDNGIYTGWVDVIRRIQWSKEKGKYLLPIIVDYVKECVEVELQSMWDVRAKDLLVGVQFLAKKIGKDMEKNANQRKRKLKEQQKKKQAEKIQQNKNKLKIQTPECLQKLYQYIHQRSTQKTQIN